MFTIQRILYVHRFLRQKFMRNMFTSGKGVFFLLLLMCRDVEKCPGPRLKWFQSNGFDRHAPFVTKRANTNISPWLTVELKNLMSSSTYKVIRPVLKFFFLR